MAENSSIKSHVGTAVGAGGAVVAAHELIRSVEDRDDHEERNAHLIKAAIGAATAVGAYELLRRDKGGFYKHHRREETTTHHHSGESDIVTQQTQMQSTSTDLSRNQIAISSTQRQETDASTYDSDSDSSQRHSHRHRSSHSHSHSRSRSRSHSHSNEGGHTRRMIEQVAGAYALGRELLGDDHHHVAHLVAEALGTVALAREAKKHMDP
ncbi:uncharacterized protein GIQ15_06564 [Arthroderma uncinatum]|uniref:uncharacterized protein n=1 Tax=Arthroderma uncinatum TaxID=74035 RepID=UPI00144AA6F7|nr:uncharacterized protein GIQ15_06564 [Arthroderma uncinatum]KAF3479588.1 hypothetical protein GIQ15_06564 [Arthroderma uncinatum]